MTTILTTLNFIEVGKKDFDITGTFDSTEWVIKPITNKSKAILNGIESLRILKSELQAFQKWALNKGLTI